MADSNAWWREEPQVPVLEPDTRHLPEPLVENPITVVEWDAVEESMSCTVPKKIRREWEHKAHTGAISMSTVHNHYSDKPEDGKWCDSVSKFFHLLRRDIANHSRIVLPDKGPVASDILPILPDITSGLREYYERPHRVEFEDSSRHSSSENSFKHVETYNGHSLSFIEGITQLTNATITLRNEFENWVKFNLPEGPIRMKPAIEKAPRYSGRDNPGEVPEYIQPVDSLGNLGVRIVRRDPEELAEISLSDYPLKSGPVYRRPSKGWWKRFFVHERYVSPDLPIYVETYP